MSPTVGQRVRVDCKSSAFSGRAGLVVEVHDSFGFALIDFDGEPGRIAYRHLRSVPRMAPIQRILRGRDLFGGAQ